MQHDDALHVCLLECIARDRFAFPTFMGSTKLYIGIPTPPRALISLANLSSAARRDATSSRITTAATLAPCTFSGCAVGDFHEETNVVLDASTAVVEGDLALPLVELQPAMNSRAADESPIRFRVCLSRVLP
jgi:hypothetical protein